MKKYKSLLCIFSTAIIITTIICAVILPSRMKDVTEFERLLSTEWRSESERKRAEEKISTYLLNCCASRQKLEEILSAHGFEVNTVTSTDAVLEISRNYAQSQRHWPEDKRLTSDSFVLAFRTHKILLFWESLPDWEVTGFIHNGEAYRVISRNKPHTY